MSKSSGSKGRGRNRNNGKRPQGRGGNFDPNSGRNRGNAQQLMDKYLSLARDAASQGDRIAAENYFQHADHYYRVIYARNEQQEARRRAASNHDNESSTDPIPVQSVDDGQGPVGLVQPGNGQGNGKSADSDNAADAQPSENSANGSGGEEEEAAKPAKPRRGRPPKKAKQDGENSQSNEAAQ